MEDEPEQEALFEIAGPDEDDCVWIQSTNPSQPWGVNLGPADAVAERLSEWLGSVEYLEHDK